MSTPDRALAVALTPVALTPGALTAVALTPRALVLGALVLGLHALPLQAQESRPAARELDVPAARAALDRGLAFLERTQRRDGGWNTAAIEGLLDSEAYALESFYAWQHAAHSLACLAFLRAPRTGTRDAALGRGVAWYLTARMPLRGDEWDNDALWAHLYGVGFAAAALGDARFADGPQRAALERNARAHLGWLERNQTPGGGFGYYDDPPYTRRPKWATSFSTALVLPALAWCEDAGWLDPRVRARATDYVRRCRLPNGAWQYDLRPVPRYSGGEHIDHVKGSLGRIQVCNWGLRASGEPQPDDAAVRAGLQQFFDHHEFLLVARLRPVPHEAYYANAGYFYFFGHYYAALAIGLLPEPEREAWHRRLRAEIVPTLRADGSTADFLTQGYLVTASTAFAVLALREGLHE